MEATSSSVKPASRRIARRKSSQAGEACGGFPPGVSRKQAEEACLPDLALAWVISVAIMPDAAFK